MLPERKFTIIAITPYNSNGYKIQAEYDGKRKEIKLVAETK